MLLVQALIPDSSHLAGKDACIQVRGKLRREEEGSLHQRDGRNYIQERSLILLEVLRLQQAQVRRGIFECR